MTVLGHGVDLVDIASFRRLLEDADADFAQRCFTQTELSVLTGTAHDVEHLAGVFAAKESIAKALRTGFDERVTPLNIEISRLPSGAPDVVLKERAASIATELGIVTWHLSVAHTDSVAIASVIALGTPVLT